MPLPLSSTSHNTFTYNNCCHPVCCRCWSRSLYLYFQTSIFVSLSVCFFVLSFFVTICYFLSVSSSSKSKIRHLGNAASSELLDQYQHHHQRHRHRNSSSSTSNKYSHRTHSGQRTASYSYGPRE